MRTKQRRNTRLGKLIVPTIAVAFVAYFALHVQSGQYGLESKGHFETVLAQKTEELRLATRERERLEIRVSLLQDGSLERDMIDERARRYLNVGAEDEIMILR